MAFESYLLGALCAFLLGMLFARILRSGPPVDAYRHEAPALDVSRYFEGRWHAAGIMEDVSGRVVARYRVELTATRDEGEVTLAETWYDEAGGSEVRTIRLQADASGNIRGNGSHIRGELSGKQRGKVLELRYGLKRTLGSKEAVFNVIERNYVIDGGYFIRKTQMRKFGLGMMSLVAGYYKETM